MVSPVDLRILARADPVAVDDADLARLLEALLEGVGRRLAGAQAEAGISRRSFDLLEDAVLASTAATRLLADPTVLDVLPVTASQRLMVLRHLRDGAQDPNYNQYRIRLEGAVDERIVAGAWDALTVRHPALRMSIEWEGLPQPVVAVRSTGSQLQVRDWRELAPERAEIRLAQLEDPDAHPRPRLSGRTPIEVTLILLPDRSELLWRDHHVLLDGWATQALLAELVDACRRLRAGRTAFEGVDPPVDPSRVLRWRAETTVAANLWGDAAEGFVSPTPLPGARTLALPPGRSADYVSAECEISTGLAAELAAASARQRVTAAALVGTVWAAILHRACGAGKVCFGLSLHGRPSALGEPTQLIGNHATALPVFVPVAPESSIGELAGVVAERMWALQEASGALELADAYAATGMPLGRMMFASLLVTHGYDSGAGPAPSADPREIRIATAHGSMRTGLPLTLNCSTERVQVVVDRRMFASGTAERLAQAIVDLLPVAARSPATTVAELPVPLFDTHTDQLSVVVSRHPMPRDGREKQVAGIWHEILGCGDVGRHVTVFEVGATSLSLVALSARLSAAVGRPVPVTEVFDRPTIASMAELLDNDDDSSRLHGPAVDSGDRVARRRKALADQKERRTR